MPEIRDGGPTEGFTIRQAGEIEIDGPDGKETIRGLILEGSVADIRPAMVWFGERVKIAPLAASMPEDVKPVAWQRRRSYPNAPGEIPQWEPCSGREATGHFERVAGYEYRPLYDATALASLSAKVEELTRANEDAQSRIEELESEAEHVSAEFEGDCWKAMRSLLTLCHYDWRDVAPEGVTADEAREYISSTFTDMDESEARQRARAETAEASLAERDRIITEKDKALELEVRRATDAEYMAHAYRVMLGEKGSAVAQMWDDKGVKRVHHDWDASAAELTGEQRAQVLLDWESAPRREIDPSEIDGPRSTKLSRPISEFLDEIDARDRRAS